MRTRNRPATSNMNQEHSKRPPAKSIKRLNQIAREEYQKIFGEPFCMMCGNPKADVHHRDGDRRNNDPSNMQPLCRSCHVTHHNIQRGIMNIEKARSS